MKYREPIRALFAVQEGRSVLNEELNKELLVEVSVRCVNRLHLLSSLDEAHLGHVFAKLSLSTRAELAAEATRRGL